MATPSSILAWETPWTEGPGGLQSRGSQRVRHDGTHSSHTSTTFRLEGLENSPPRKVSSALRPFLQPLKMVLLYGALKNLLVLLSITCVWYTGSLSMALPHLSLNILLSSVTERDVESWKDPAFGLK